MGTENRIKINHRYLVFKDRVKLNNPLMGTENTNF